MFSQKTTIIIRFVFYTLLLGLIFTQLFFYGILCLIPIDLMIFAEGNQNVWGLLFILLFGSLAFIYVEKSKRNSTNHKFWEYSRKYTMPITLLLSFFLLGLTFWSFLRFTKYNHNPWLIQAGWFLRDHGIIWGAYLGVSVFIGVLIFDEIRDMRSILSSSIWNIEIPVIYKTGILFLSFLFTGITLLLYRFTSLSGVFTFFLFIVSCSVILFLLSRTWDFRKSIQFESDHGGSKENNISRGVRNTLWFVCGLALMTMILYPMNLSIDVRVHRLPIHQLFALLVGLTIGITAIYHFSDYLIQNYFFNQKNSQRQPKKVFEKTFRIFLLIVVIINLFVLGFGLYIYEFVLFLPQVIAKTVFWAILGLFIYIAIEKFFKNCTTRHLFFVVVLCVAISAQILNFVLVLSDLQANALTGIYLRNTEIDIVYPFQFLFTFPNILITGISMGYLIGILIGTSNPISKDSKVSKEFVDFFVFLAPATVGVLIGLSSIFVDIPNGGPSMAIIPLEVINPILISGLILIVILTAGNFLFKRGKELRNTSSISFKDTFTRITQNIRVGPEVINKIRASMIITGIVFIGIGGGLISILAVESNNARCVSMLSHNQNYSVWMANSSERFNKHISISLTNSPQINVIKFSVAKNEYHAFQIGWTLNKKTLSNFHYVISDFTLISNSSKIIPHNTSQLRYEEFIFEEEFLDKLVPFENKTLESRQTHFLWFDIRTPYNATSGHYSGNISCNFLLDGTPEVVIIPIQFFVWDFPIPLQRHLRTIMGEGEFIEEMFDVSIDNWVQHRFNMYGDMDLIWGTVDYTEFLENEYKAYYLNTSQTTNAWTFNWTKWDNYLDPLVDAGMNAIRLAYIVNRSLILGRSLLLDYPIENQWFLDWLNQVETHFDAKGWLNICYYYFVDEFSLFLPDGISRSDYFDQVEIQLQQMKDAAPKIRILAVAPPSDELEQLKPYIDIYCPVSYDIKVDDWNKARDEGKEMWFYTCVSPFAEYPNVHLYNRLFESRLLMWNAWYIQADGFLFWKANSGKHGQYGLGHNGYGDGFLIFENREELEIYDTLRWENFGDGQEDYELFWLLNATLNEIEALLLMDSTSTTEYRMRMCEIIDEVADVRTDYARNPHDIYNGRHEVGEMLHELSALVDIQEIGERVWYPRSGIPP